MRAKNKYRLELVNYLLNNIKFKIIIGVIIFFCIYELVFADISYGFINSVITIISSLSYVALVSLCLCVSTSLVYNKYHDNTFYIMRLGNKKEYIKDLLFNIIIINTFAFWSSILFLLLLIIIKSGFNLGLGVSVYSYIPNWLYLIFMMVRIYIITILFSLFFAIMMKVVNIYIGNILFYIYCFLILRPSIIDFGVIDTIAKMPLEFIYYFRPIICSTFLLEIIISALYIVVLGMINVGIYLVYDKAVKGMDIQI